MIKTLRELKSELDARAAVGEIERDDEGRAVIGMTVVNDDDFLSDYSLSANPSVNPEIADYLNESVMALPPQTPLHVKIHSDCIDEDEQSVYTCAIRGYYERRYRETAVSLKHNATISLVMLLIGILALAVGVSVSLFTLIPVLGETLDIFAWVFIWEAVDLFFLERKLLKIKQSRHMRFYEAVIEYCPRSQK